MNQMDIFTIGDFIKNWGIIPLIIAVISLSMNIRTFLGNPNFQ